MPKFRKKPSGTAITSCVRDITSANKANSTHADQHAKGGSDPITPESIGAAPGGFGLGGAWNPAPENDANQIPGTGWFMAHQNTPTGGWGIIQDISNNTVRYQFAFAQTYNSGVLGGTIVQRNKQQGQNDWGAWEYVNPPMVLGVEYRTTERYLGKPVYIKVTACGSGPTTDSKKFVEDPIQNYDKTVGSGGNLGDSNGLPYYGGESRQLILSVGKYGIDLYAIGFDASANNVVVWRKYTKITN